MCLLGGDGGFCITGRALEVRLLFRILQKSVASSEPDELPDRGISNEIRHETCIATAIAMSEIDQSKVSMVRMMRDWVLHAWQQSEEGSCVVVLNPSPTYISGDGLLSTLISQRDSFSQA